MSPTTSEATRSTARPVCALDDTDGDLLSLERAFRRLGREGPLRTWLTSPDLLAEVAGGPSRELPNYGRLALDAMVEITADLDDRWQRMVSAPDKLVP